MEIIIRVLGESKQNVIYMHKTLKRIYLVNEKKRKKLLVREAQRFSAFAKVGVRAANILAKTLILLAEYEGRIEYI